LFEKVKSEKAGKIGFFDGQILRKLSNIEFLGFFDEGRILKFI
jgi:hypothetical protein